MPPTTPALPETGRLQIDVMALDIAKPITNATVRVTPRGRPSEILGELATDDSGQTYTIDLPAPPAEYSQQPSTEKPYSEYDVSVSYDGYEQVIVQGVQILPNTVSYQDVTLNPLVGYQQEFPEKVTIDEHTLWGDFPPKIPEAEVKPLPPTTGLVVLPEPVVPEFVVVHMGMPANTAAQRFWVPFKDYIKNAICIKNQTD
ncbi:MAG: carboxypeptidase-like regulatory domain-containing protein [Defluviitaleaceae bacterium]|nr:carboxypeptidase-like regulatory domain-containing protein [Defluviitaleaceae bacterium]